MSAVGWRAWAVGALGVLQAAGLVRGGGEAPVTQLVVVLAAAALGSLALGWIVLERRFANTPVFWVFGLAVVLRLIAIQAEPLLEDDHFRYLWDGLRTVQHFDPYRLAPSAYFAAQDIEPRWQDVLSGINNPDVPTIYGPVLQALFALGHLLAPGRIVAIQGLLMLVDLACMSTLARQGLEVRWLLAYALHPMILKEAMASAHPDGLVALWLLCAMLTWQRGRSAWTGALLGLAVATKVAALVAVPLFLFGRQPLSGFWKTAGAVAFGFGLALGLAYLPFLVAGGSDVVGLATFASQWRFNPLLFRLIEAAVPDGLARPVAAAVIVGAVIVLAWRSCTLSGPEAATGGTPMPPVGEALLLLILLAPVVNPWYALWALGPAMAARQPLVAVLGCVSMVSYLNGSVLQQAGWLDRSAAIAPFAVAWPVTLVQLGVVASAAWVWRHFLLCAASGDTFTRPQ